jgi:hypothetical protein
LDFQARQNPHRLITYASRVELAAVVPQLVTLTEAAVVEQVDLEREPVSLLDQVLQSQLAQAAQQVLRESILFFHRSHQTAVDLVH